MLYAGDEMADEWDSSPAWAEARARTKAEVQAAFAPTQQTCPACGRAEATASRHCPHCGGSYVVVQPKLSKRAKLTIGGVALAVLAAGGIAWALASPSIDNSKRATARRAAAQQAEFIRTETARLKADQRLHRARAATPGEPRARLVVNLESAITADALARVKAGTFDGPIHGTTCQPVALGPLVPDAARGGYQCVAVNAEIRKGVEVGGQIGYPFWAVVNYRRGTFAWCKINPKPGEMATQSREPVVNPPAACDLHI
jgi:hypothetical protein